jgi:hypothetical protein
MVKHATAKIYFEGLAKFAVKLDDRVDAECKRLEFKHQNQKSVGSKLRNAKLLFNTMVQTTGN